MSIKLNDAKVVETDWDFSGDEDNADWTFCNSDAIFEHKSACEFILWVPEELDCFEGEVCKMREAGCSLELIEAFTQARLQGACRLLLFS